MITNEKIILIGEYNVINTVLPLIMKLQNCVCGETTAIEIIKYASIVTKSKLAIIWNDSWEWIFNNNGVMDIVSMEVLFEKFHWIID